MLNRREYIEDATPCKQCGVVPTDRIEEAPAMTLCGIPVGGSRYGAVLRCPKCNLQIALDRNEPGQPFVKKKANMKFRFWNRKDKHGKNQGEMLWFRDLEKESYGHEIMIDERVLECPRDHFIMRRDELVAQLHQITIGGAHES